MGCPRSSRSQDMDVLLTQALSRRHWPLGWLPCAVWKWISGSRMEQCCHIPAEPCLWGTLLEPHHRFPGNSKSLFGREISWH